MLGGSPHENAVKQRPKGADISDLLGPVRQRRGPGAKAKADGRASRSRSRSPQGGREGARGTGTSVRQATSQPGALPAMGMMLAADGPLSAGMQYAVSREHENLFDSEDVLRGVPGLGVPLDPSPSAQPGAPGTSGTSELNQAVSAQLPASMPASPMVL